MLFVLVYCAGWSVAAVVFCNASSLQQMWRHCFARDVAAVSPIGSPRMPALTPPSDAAALPEDLALLTLLGHLILLCGVSLSLGLAFHEVTMAFWGASLFAAEIVLLLGLLPLHKVCRPPTQRLAPLAALLAFLAW
eukprot:RCo034441